MMQPAHRTADHSAPGQRGRIDEWHVSCFEACVMSSTLRPQTMLARRCCLRRAGAGLVALLGGSALRAAESPSPPRLKFRSRRAACSCDSDIDDEAIERAAAQRQTGTAAKGEKAESPAPAGSAARGGTERTAEPTTTRRP